MPVEIVQPLTLTRQNRFQARLDSAWGGLLVGLAFVAAFAWSDVLFVVTDEAFKDDLSVSARKAVGGVIVTAYAAFTILVVAFALARWPVLQQPILSPGEAP